MWKRNWFRRVMAQADAPSLADLRIAIKRIQT
jgi:hypothetical protein